MIVNDVHTLVSNEITNKRIELIIAFNMKPKAGIEAIRKIYRDNVLVDVGVEKEIAKFFFKEWENLNLDYVGEYLGSGREENKNTLNYFVKQLNFKEKSFTEGLRDYLKTFKLPGEAGPINNLMEAFGNEYCNQNQNSDVANEDAAYILAYATIMLNTDLHSSSIEKNKKMTFEQFKYNVRGVNDKKDFDSIFLEQLYSEIKEQPFELNFTEIVPGYELDNSKLNNDQVFNQLSNALTSDNVDITNIFTKLKDNSEIKVTFDKPKSLWQTWLQKLTGYQGSIIVEDKIGIATVQIYKPDVFSAWFLHDKPKIIIQPTCKEGKESTTRSIEIAAKIAASFETPIKTCAATYDYLKKNMQTDYNKYKSPETNIHKSQGTHFQHEMEKRKHSHNNGHGI